VNPTATRVGQGRTQEFSSRAPNPDPLARFGSASPTNVADSPGSADYPARVLASSGPGALSITLY
jgi:hypothetical protein